MTYTIDISQAAEDDIREAFTWYEDQKSDLGRIFQEYINNAIESIQTNPFKTQIRYANIRIYFLDKFPYGIHFKINEFKKSILIIAVFHTSIFPEKWQERT